MYILKHCPHITNNSLIVMRNGQHFSGCQFYGRSFVPDGENVHRESNPTTLADSSYSVCRSPADLAALPDFARRFHCPQTGNFCVRAQSV